MTRFDWMTVAAVASAAVLAASASLALLAGVVASMPAPQAVVDPLATGPLPSIGTGEAAGEIVIDVQGAVVVPGLHRLPAGSRVADALDAAGGYSEAADVAAAARVLNLAAPLVDGQQISVPAIGEAAGTGSGSGDGLVNLNHATQSELEALPGIGPVTAGKIIAARQERPFATLDELVSRDVLTTRQLEQIADLVTVP